MRDVSIEESLNEKQKEAVHHTEGPLLILAGAGSGKTRVIVHRIAYLVAVKDVPPRNILAITFTNKAADELRQRVCAFLGPPAEKLHLGTFHATCSRLLRENPWKKELLKNFVIYDESESASLIKKCLRELKFDVRLYPPASMKVRIRRLKDRLVSPEDFARAGTTTLMDERVARVYDLYQKRLREARAFDFDDLLMVTVQLLQSDQAILGRYQARFRYIMVDEYQDTNHAQFMLLRLLGARHENVCVVGDDDQSIYRWRGATLENILNFEKHYPAAHVVKLEENYRSTRTILSAAGSVVSRNQGRKQKNLWTGRHRGDPITYHLAWDEKSEAAYIGTTIQKLNSSGLAYRDMAVFYRTNAQSRVIEEALRADGVPYQVVGDIEFYQRREIRDLIAYLKVIANPADSVSLRRIINLPPRGIGDRTVQSLEDFCAQKDLTLYEGIAEALQKGVFSKGPESRLQAFMSMMKGILNDGRLLDPAALLRSVVCRIGYFDHLDKEDSTRTTDRKNNVNEFISSAQQFVDTQPRPTLQNFLDRLSLLSEQDLFDQGMGAVALMTLHSSKGLEFPVVFVAGMEDGLCPHSRSVQDLDGLEEERRLCYVGMTRAQEKLFLSSARRRNLNGRVYHNPPSPFIQDVPREFIDIIRGEDRLETERTTHRVPTGGKTMITPPDTGRGPFRKGAVVIHPKFGMGVVFKREGEGDGLKLTIDFKNYGQKKLVARFAQLEEI